MEENRFLRAYQEHKREKELERQSIRPNYDNRFECLRSTAPPREVNNRFKCLRDNNFQDRTQYRDTSNRFSCLVDNDYRTNSTQSSPSLSSPSLSSPSLSSPSRSITYLPRPEPRESINTQMQRLKASRPPPKPALTFESEYHFPELIKPQNIPEIKLPEQKQKEMIVNAVIVPIKKKTLTVYSFEKGKVITKDMYEDGTDVIEAGVVMVKKPNYTSWASVLKDEKNEVVYYDKEENLFGSVDKSSGKN